jgi:hypothetical protein
MHAPRPPVASVIAIGTRVRSGQLPVAGQSANGCSARPCATCAAGIAVAHGRNGCAGVCDEPSLADSFTAGGDALSSRSSRTRFGMPATADTALGLAATRSRVVWLFTASAGNATCAGTPESVSNANMPAAVGMSAAGWPLPL